MKKLIFSTLAYMLTALCAAVLLISCSDDNNSPATYAIGVTAGTGGTASADKTNPAEGETVILTAAVTEPGYTFKQWTVTSGTITLQPNAEANPATFVMPAGAVSIKAEFLAPGEAYGIAAVKIPAGTFQMGSPADEPDRYSGDETQHSVTLSKDFYMSKYQITNAQYAAFLNAVKAGSDGKFMTANYPAGQYPDTELVRDCSQSGRSAWGVKWETDKWVPVDDAHKDHPVIHVTWYGAYEYAKWIGGSLPTEAQWEYACRGGESESLPFGIGNGKELTGDMANIDGNYPYDYDNGGHQSGSGTYLQKTSPVGNYPANGYGLYDMHGNVLEWCYDSWNGSDYGSGSVTDPVSPSPGTNRVQRGGSWINNAQRCRSAYRLGDSPDNAYDDLGFRVVFVP